MPVAARALAGARHAAHCLDHVGKVGRAGLELGDVSYFPAQN
jgi:hypothetical protein